MLRNVSVVYLVALAGIETLSFIYILRDGIKYLRSWIARWYGIFLLVSFLGALQTIYSYGIGVGLYACVRFYMVAPLVPLAAIALDNTKKMAFVIKCFIGITCIGVFSIALQYVTGPVSWFAEPGERAGIMRFGSILGSLPTIGGVLPLAVFGALMIKMRWNIRSLVLLILFFGVLISLSKGSIAGTALALVLFLCIPTANKRQSIAILAIISLSVLAIVSLASSGTVLNAARTYISALFSAESAGRGGDVTMQESMIDRWTTLPAESLGSLGHARGDIGLISGGGFQMLGTSLMPDGASPYITSEDTYIDFVLIAGIPLLIAYVCLLGGTLRRLCSAAGRKYFRESPEVGSCAFGMMLILAITGLFSGGLTFQPIGASVWCILTGIGIRIESLGYKGLCLTRINAGCGAQG
jgi:hypothetical protein